MNNTVKILEKGKTMVRQKEPDGRASSNSEQKISSTPLPRPVNSLETDSEEDPDYNQEEFIRLRTSLHRKIVEAEREDLKKNGRRKGKRASNPCRKITQLFQRIFTSNSNRFPTSTTTTTASQESHLPSANLSNLKSPSSINQKLGEVHVLSCDSTDDDYLI